MDALLLLLLLLVNEVPSAPGTPILALIHQIIHQILIEQINQIFH